MLAVVVVQAASVSAERAELHDIELVQGIDGTRQTFFQVSDETLPIVLDTVATHPDAVAFGNLQADIGEPGVDPVNPGGSPIDDPNGPVYDTGPRPEFICDPGRVLRAEGERVGGAGPRRRDRGAVMALSGDIRRYRPFRLVSGEWLDFAALPSLAPRVVLNTAAAKGFQRYTVPAQMELPGATADPTPQIVGVVDDGQAGPTAYMRVDEVSNWLPPARMAQSFGGVGGAAAARAERHRADPRLPPARHRNEPGRGARRHDRRRGATCSGRSPSCGSSSSGWPAWSC